MDETVPKKLTSRNIAITLGIICIILIALIAYLTVTGISAQNSYNNLRNQKDQLQTWLDGNETLLNQTQFNITAYNNYVIDHPYTYEEYQNLTRQINNLEAPKLIEVNLRFDDVRNYSEGPYLHVSGEVCNVGTDTAYNCILHMLAYQSGGVKAIDGDIVLNNFTMDGQSWTSADASPVYSGGALTNVTITPEWTAGPIRFG